MIFRRKNIFDILKEAEDDQEQSEVGQNATDNTQDEAPSAEESNEQGTDNEEYGNEDDFNVDTALDDEGGEDTGEEGGGEDDLGGGDMDTSSDTSSNLDGGDSEEEPIKANTDIFNSLTAEEQQIKIRELKNLFLNLYTSTDDLLARLNETETDEDNIEVITRVSMILYSLKQYMEDYMTYSFGFKSYIENDIAFNRFLAILKSATTIVEEIGKIKMVKLGGKPDKKS